VTEQEHPGTAEPQAADSSRKVQVTMLKMIVLTSKDRRIAFAIRRDDALQSDDLGG
jgi:hypothetical protein